MRLSSLSLASCAQHSLITYFTRHLSRSYVFLVMSFRSFPVDHFIDWTKSTVVDAMNRQHSANGDWCVVLCVHAFTCRNDNNRRLHWIRNSIGFCSKAFSLFSACGLKQNRTTKRRRKNMKQFSVDDLKISLLHLRDSNVLAQKSHRSTNTGTRENINHKHTNINTEQENGKKMHFCVFYSRSFVELQEKKNGWISEKNRWTNEKIKTKH